MEGTSQKINSVIEDSMGRVEKIADVNMIIGKPIITASGFQIIPFSKITLGNLAGGGEYGDVKVVKTAEEFPFAGGSGAVVSMKPMGFLIDDGKSCHILRISDDALDKFVERAGEIIRDVMSKNE